MIANIHGAHELGLHSLIKLPDDFPDAAVMAGSSVFLPSMSKNAGKNAAKEGNEEREQRENRGVGSLATQWCFLQPIALAMHALGLSGDQSEPYSANSW